MAPRFAHGGGAAGRRHGTAGGDPQEWNSDQADAASQASLPVRGGGSDPRPASGWRPVMSDAGADGGGQSPPQERSEDADGSADGVWAAASKARLLGSHACRAGLWRDLVDAVDDAGAWQLGRRDRRPTRRPHQPSLAGSRSMLCPTPSHSPYPPAPKSGAVDAHADELAGLAVTALAFGGLAGRTPRSLAHQAVTAALKQSPTFARALAGGLLKAFSSKASPPPRDAALGAARACRASVIAVTAGQWSVAATAGRQGWVAGAGAATAGQASDAALGAARASRSSVAATARRPG